MERKPIKTERDMGVQLWPGALLAQEQCLGRKGWELGGSPNLKACMSVDGETERLTLFLGFFWHSQCNSQCYGPLYGITCIYCLGISYKGSPEASQYHLLVFYEMNFSQGHSSCCSAKRKTFWLRNKKTPPQCYHPGAHLAPARRLNLTPRFLLWPWQDWNLSVSFNAFILCFVIMLLWPQWSEDIKEMRLAVAPSWEKKEEIHLSFLLGNSKEGERLYLQQCSGFSGRLYKLVLKIQFKILKIN